MTLKKIVFVGVIGILFYFGFGIYHEYVHIEILRSYGIESHIEYFSHFPDLVTVSEPHSEEQCPDSCKLAHNINEVVGYQLGIVLLFLIVMAVLWAGREEC